MTRTTSLLVVLCSCLWYKPSSTLVTKRIKPWVNDPICGMPQYAPRTTGRVVGGDVANPHSWPWRAMLICSSQASSRSSICGGSIISSQWILTAAHCVDSRVYDITQDCTVYLGRHYLPKHQSSAESTEQVFSIVHYVIHDHYNPSDLESGSDLALLKLSRVIKYTKEILPICLAFDQDELTETSVCYSGGWGFTDGQRKESISQVLKQIRLPIQMDSYCSFTRKSAKLRIIICAGKWDRAQNLCYGDSGGALECKSESRWYLHGVLSQVDKECVSVASFAKVKMFQSWIESNT